jgi:hypothetical protein
MTDRMQKGLAGLAALIVIGGGAVLIGNASSGGASNGANAATHAPGNFQRGARPGGPGPGFGTPATGANADKAKAAALKKYPGTAERVMKTPDGGYLVHVLRSSGEVRVIVTSSFAVQGVAQRPAGPPPGASPNGGGAPPAAPNPGSGSSSGSASPS